MAGMATRETIEIALFFIAGVIATLPITVQRYRVARQRLHRLERRRRDKPR
jgi:hypothetical protein